MDISRRNFLKLSGSTLLISTLGVNLDPTRAYAQGLRIRNSRETLTICPYCAVGCGIIVHTSEGKVVNCEGDPEHPINEGALCSKGQSLYQIVNNPMRLTRPRYRSPGATEWKEVEWDWALDEIAKRIKESRDRTFKSTSKSKVKEKAPDGREIEVEKKFVVNRTEGIAHVGSAALDNEECYMLQKLLRSWGLVYIEHQARVCHSPTVPALAESFGRGAMTSHWIDFRNADVILVMGGNPAENHPVSMKWIMKAKEKGAGYEKLYGETDLGGLGVLYAFKDAPRVYGMDEKPAIPESVVFWHNVLKPLAYIGLGGIVAASLLHYVAFGPKKDE